MPWQREGREMACDNLDGATYSLHKDRETTIGRARAWGWHHAQGVTYGGQPYEAMLCPRCAKDEKRRPRPKDEIVDVPLPLEVDMTDVAMSEQAPLVPTVKQFELDVAQRVFWDDFWEANRIVSLYKERFKQLFADAEEITIDGMVVATFKRDTKFASAAFAKEHPMIAARYMTKRLVEVFDEQRFKQDHPMLWELGRSKSLRRKN